MLRANGLREVTSRVLRIVAVAFPGCLPLMAFAGAPTLSSGLTPPAICSYAPFNYVPTSASPNVGFSWTTTLPAGIKVAPGTPVSGLGAINMAMGNTTTAPIPVTFVFTLTQGGATNTQSVVVVVNPLPTAGFTEDKTSECLAGNVFNFTNTSKINSGTLTYTWDLGDGTTAGTTDASHSYTAGGTYTIALKATSDQGCVTVATHTVTVNQAAVPNFTYALQAPYNNNNYVFTSTSQGSPTSYAWTFGDGTPVSTATNPPHQYATAGTYPVTLTVTNAQGCTASVTENVTTAVPSATGAAHFTIEDAAGDPTAIQGQCTGVNFTFQDNTVGTITSRTWNFGDGSPGVTTNTPPKHPYATAGTYTVTETVTFSDATTATVSQALNVYPSPNISINPAFLGAICSGSNSKALYFQPTSDGLSFSWVVGNTTLGASSGSGSYFPSFTAVNNTTAQITSSLVISGTSPYGCPVGSKNLNFSVNPVPTLTSTLAPVEVCSGTQITFPAFASNVGGTTYKWTNSNPVSGLAASGTGSIAPFTATNYAPTPSPSTVVVTPFLGGCAGAAQQAVFTVDPTPQLDTPITGFNQCSGATFQFNPQSFVPATTFNWTRAAVPGLQNSATSGSNAISEGLISDTATPVTVNYVYTLQAGNCSNTQDVTVQVLSKPMLSGTLDTSLCSGVPFAYPASSATPGTTFAWTRAVTGGISNPAKAGSGGIADTLVSTVETGVPVTYVYTLTAGVCTQQQNLVVNINPVPTLSAPGAAGQTLCAGANSAAVAFIVAPAGTPYTWTNSNATIGLLPSGTGDIPSFPGSNSGATPISGNVIVQAKTAAGCASAPSTPYTITVNPTPIASLTTAAGTTWCPGTPLPMTGGGGASYQWYLDGVAVPGATNALFTANDSGRYTLSVANTYGCTDSTWTQVSTFPKPQAFFTYNASCLDSPVVFTNTSSEAGNFPVNYEWSDNDGHTSTALSPTFVYSTSGNYSVQLVVSPQGCAAQSTTYAQPIVIVLPPPGERLPDQFVEAGQGAPISGRSLEGASYDWTPAVGLSDPTIIDPAALLTAQQVYNIAMTLPTGCVTTDTLRVDIIPKNLVYIPSAFTPNGDGRNDLFVIAGLNNYPGSSLAVFDRWGKEVYFASSYQNNWDGGGQPQGVYVYVLELKYEGGGKEYRGTLTVVR